MDRSVVSASLESAGGSVQKRRLLAAKGLHFSPSDDADKHGQDPQGLPFALIYTQCRLPGGSQALWEPLQQVGSSCLASPPCLSTLLPLGLSPPRTYCHSPSAYSAFELINSQLGFRPYESATGSISEKTMIALKIQFITNHPGIWVTKFNKLILFGIQNLWLLHYSF